jgi:hypothetical protein
MGVAPEAIVEKIFLGIDSKIVISCLHHIAISFIKNSFAFLFFVGCAISSAD